MESFGDLASGTAPDGLVERARTLLTRGGTLESSFGSGPIPDAELTKAVASQLAKLAPGSPQVPAGPGPAEIATAKKAIDTARAALGKGPTHKPSEEDLSALELIVQTVGRPALRYRDSRVELPPNRLGDNSRWVVLITQEREKINQLSSSIGRIYCSQGSSVPVLGTGWRVGPDLIVTNRHVAQSLVVDRTASPDSWKVNKDKKPVVDFAYTDGVGGPSLCGLGDLLFCANPDDVDMAIFKVMPGCTSLPAAIQIDWSEAALGQVLPATPQSPTKFQGEEIYAVGHPYWPNANEQARKLFGDVDGRKRCSPGLVTGIDPTRPILLHDSSTLSGNSGSCIAVVGSGGHVAVGLHFGGKELTTGIANALGSTNYAIAFARLGSHPAVPILKRSP
ncbi:trypsin-like serine peptidase [Bradyrhizobium sp. DASA03068]|uniref:trypsin-like serine peptidase n=1 Tax=Bradyrhizobium sp. BLXBL-01 TaxID=3395915 RepID=UPI003F72D15A